MAKEDKVVVKEYKDEPRPVGANGRNRMFCTTCGWIGDFGELKSAMGYDVMCPFCGSFSDDMHGYLPEGGNQLKPWRKGTTFVVQKKTGKILGTTSQRFPGGLYCWALTFMKYRYGKSDYLGNYFIVHGKKDASMLPGFEEFEGVQIAKP